MLEGRETTLVMPYATVEAMPGAGDAPGAEQARLLEARLSWGRELLAVRHVGSNLALSLSLSLSRARRAIRVRDLGLDACGADDLVVATRDARGELTLRLPGGAAVPPGCAMALRLGRATLRLSLVADDAEAPPPPRLDSRIALGVIAAAALHVTVMGFVVAGRAPAGADAEASRETMQRIMASAEERALAELAAAQAAAAKAEPVKPADGAPAATKKDEGTAGNPARTNDGSVARITRGEDRRLREARRSTEPPTSTPSERDEAATFGILALLAGTTRPTTGGNSAFAAETGPSAMGNIFGQTIDDAAGVGGLGLSGAGEGAGGLGAGVPLGAVGTIGHTDGSGTAQGFGCCGGKLPRREHVARFGFRFVDGELSVNGRLPPEAIQRVVRQSFGRLRACYETGLARDPGLEGRVSVKFVIDRSGSVALAAPMENSTGDAAVGACVTRAYSAMTFPQPEGGIVTVVYPVVFTRSEP